MRVETCAPSPNRKGSVGRRDGSGTFPPESWDIAPTPADPRAMLPLAIHHDGRLGGTIRLYAESEDVQLTWKSKLDEAIQLRWKSSQVFEMSVLAREEFLTMGANGGQHTYPPQGNRINTEMITCASPFSTHIVLSFTLFS